LKKLDAPTQTIAGKTFGLDAALKQHEEMSTSQEWPNVALSRLAQASRKQEKMRRCAGFLCYIAPSIILRETALTTID
jgi:hypothetical protein